MKRALLYIRVSTTRQDLEGYSIPMQKERLINFCKAKGWAVVGVFIDPGHSGASLERPGMTALIDAVESKKGDVVLVYKLDRLSRSQRDVLYLLEDVFEPRGVAFVSTMESFDTSTTFGKAVLGILSVFGAMERSTITERTMMGRAGRAEEGLFHGGGTSPIGYDYIDGELVVNEDEADQVRMVYGYYADGFSVTEITRRMDGYTTKHGDWSHTSTVGNVLDNPLYAGTVHFDGIRAKGQHDAIISEELDARVKARRARVRLSESSGDSNHLLTGIIYCAACGARYFPNKRPNGRVVYSCHSRAKKNKKMVRDPYCKSPHIPIEELDAMVEAEVLRLAANPAEVDELIKKRAAEGGDSKAVDRSEDIRRIDGEIGKLMDLLAHNDSTASVREVADRIADLHEERERLNEFRRPIRKTFAGATAKQNLHNIRFSWDSSPLRQRRVFLLQLVDTVKITASGGIIIEWCF